MKNKFKLVRMWIKIIFNLLLFLIGVYFIYYFFENNIYAENCKSNLSTDGFIILYDPEYCICNKNPSQKFREDILNNLPEGYEFIDYSYTIKNTSLFTFHRDVTSSKYLYDTTYPIYTSIIYKYDGDLLSLCPASHSTYPFVNSQILNISGKKGTAFLFDSDILHCGCQNNCIRPEITQYKICHKDDLYLLHHLIGIHTEKEDSCNISFYNSILRKLSYYFEIPINVCFYPLMTNKQNENTIIGKIQTYLPINFYNNT
jgi:hypothetical protein